MATLANLALVFIAGLITALATGLGALPFFVFEEIDARARPIDTTGGIGGLD